jgi:hypothetical protein
MSEAQQPSESRRVIDWLWDSSTLAREIAAMF